MNSRSRTATTVGILFFVQMATAIGGTTLIRAFADGDTDRAPLTIGVLLMMCSGIAVVGIGLLMYPVLKTVNPRLALWYPVLRIIEFTVSAACGSYVLHRLLRCLPPDPVGGRPEPPPMGLHPDRHRRPHPHLPALRLTTGPSTHRRARSRWVHLPHPGGTT